MIIIIGILAAIAIPMFLNQRDKAKDVGRQGRRPQHPDRRPELRRRQQRRVSGRRPVDGRLGTYVDNWPKNPWTNVRHGRQRATKGDYTYTSGAGNDFTLVGHMTDGELHRSRDLTTDQTQRSRPGRLREQPPRPSLRLAAPLTTASATPKDVPTAVSTKLAGQSGRVAQGQTTCEGGAQSCRARPSRLGCRHEARSLEPVVARVAAGSGIDAGLPAGRERMRQRRSRGLHPHRAADRDHHHRHPRRDRDPDVPQPAGQGQGRDRQGRRAHHRARASPATRSTTATRIPHAYGSTGRRSWTTPAARLRRQLAAEPVDAAMATWCERRRTQGDYTYTPTGRPSRASRSSGHWPATATSSVARRCERAAGR